MGGRGGWGGQQRKKEKRTGIKIRKEREKIKETLRSVSTDSIASIWPIED